MGASILGKITRNSQFVSLHGKSQTSEHFSDLNTWLNQRNQPQVNQDGFFGKPGKYLSSDLQKLREEEKDKRMFGRPTARNDAEIKDLVSNHYNEEFTRQ